MGIEISNKTDYSCDESRLSSLATFTLEKMRVHPESDLSITLCDESEMTDLHVQWMNLPGPTDVLSFPMDEMRPGQKAIGILGDIVLCPAFAERQILSTQRSLEEELDLLTVHGILHLLGYDHVTTEDEKAMFSLQDQCLHEWRESV
jgi:probable rRNA maturation factor